MTSQNQGTVIFVGRKETLRGFGENLNLAESNAREVAARLANLAGGEVVDIHDLWGQEAVGVQLPFKGTCGYCGFPVLTLVSDGDIVYVAEDIELIKDARNYSFKLPGRRFKLVGQVSTCRGHHHTDPALIPLVYFLGEWVPGEYTRVGGRDERGNPFYADLPVPAGLSKEEAANLIFGGCEAVSPMGDGRLATRPLPIGRFSKEAADLRAAYEAWLRRDRGSMRRLKEALQAFFA